MEGLLPHSKTNFDIEFLQRIMTLLEHQFGSKCEIVLHDYSKPYDHTIIDIRNSHITGRTIGDSGTNLGLEVIRGTVEDGDKYNYITHTREGKILRSSSLYFYDDNEEVVGALCINYDITDSVVFEKYLKDFNNYHINDEQPVQEMFAKNVGELVEYFLAEGLQHIGKPVSDMDREDKMKMLKFLDDKGVFLITKSGDRICEALDISKFTMYNYLDILRRPENGATDTNQ